MKPRKFLEITPVDPGNIADTKNIVTVYSPMGFRDHIEEIPSNQVLLNLLYEGKSGDTVFHNGSYYLAVHEVIESL